MTHAAEFGKVTDQLVARLREALGEGNVLTGEERQSYSRDEAPRGAGALPEAVVRPGDTSAVAAVMKLANEHRVPVTARGAGTGLSGGAVPVHGGIVLSLERMNRILEIDHDNFVATVEPAVTLADLYEAVEAHQLYYPLYPGEKSATIGGNVATNAGGMRAVKYGVTRHFVLGLEAVLPSGEVVQTGGKYVKCSTGYDLTQLLVGSEGTLAVITKVMLRLLPPPGRSEILFIPFPGLHQAIHAVPDILAQGIVPVGIEFMQQDIIRLVERLTGREVPLHDHEAFLMIIVEAESDDEFLRLSERIGAVCLSHGAIDVYVPGSQRAKRNLMEAREKFYPAMQHFGILEIADVVVPRSLIADFVEKAKDIAEGYGIPLIACGHAGDGNVHLCLMGDKAQPSQDTAGLLSRIFEVGASMGGTVSGEHGIGFAKKDFMPLAADEAKLRLMRRLKTAFDPNNIMNPGKVL
jgi:glycolate oxidase